MRASQLIYVLAVAFNGAASAQEVLARDQLRRARPRIADSVRDFTPKDQFDTGPRTPSLAGRRFSYTVVPSEDGSSDCSGYPDWMYVPSRGELNVSWSPGFALAYEMKMKAGAQFPPGLVSLSRNAELAFRAFTCRRENEPDYLANNAFGAQFRVSKSTEFVTAIADFEPMVEKGFPNSWTVAVTGDSARLLSQNARVRVSGSLADWGPGVSVVCGSKIQTPTISVPRDRTVNICMVKGRADRVEVVDASTGRTLFLATRKPR